MATPRKGKAKAKMVNGRKVSYGQAGLASDGKPRVRAGTKRVTHIALDLLVKRRDLRRRLKIRIAH